MNLQSQLHRAGHLARSNSPMLLTGASIAGVITTAVLTARATIKASQVIHEVEAQEIADTGKLSDTNEAKGERIKKVVKASWPLYIPPAISTVATIGCMVGSTRISANRTAAALTAYAISEKAFSDHKAKVAEMMGAAKEERIRAALAQDKVNANPVPDELKAIAAANNAKVLQGEQSSEIVILGKHVRFMEGFTGRYFLSNADIVNKAVNAINAQIIKDGYGYASMSQFYDMLDIRHTQMSDDWGWNLDKQLEIDFYTVICEDNEPCMAFDYKYPPQSLVGPNGY